MYLIEGIGSVHGKIDVSTGPQGAWPVQSFPPKACPGGRIPQNEKL